ncbi:hypothetical protein ACHZ97_14635 [Lysobacter soli]|uniref:hypothetical protein n=1 Tax=Lysobacter soli TaxID=453783 RepID=UPI0037CAD348
MSDETPNVTDVAAPAAPVESKPVPKSDAEAAQMGADTPKEPEPKAEPPKPDPEAEKKRNRTTEYIDRLKTESRDLRARVAELEARQAPQAPAKPAAAPEGKPTLESCNYDLEEYAEKLSDWKLEQHARSSAEKAQKDTEKKTFEETIQSYETKRLAFIEEHPDFEEVVGTVDPRYLTQELQMAVISHPDGPALAYHLATNEDDLFDIASRRPELYGDALNRLSKRLSAAPSQPETPAPDPTPVAIAKAPAKPISQAPAPTPTVSGRAPAVVDESKLTDEEWFKREKEKARKR